MRRRLDQTLVDRGLVATRSRGRDLVRRGCVQVCGHSITKPGELIDPGATIVIVGDHGYVSRGRLKLEAALDAFALDPAGRIAVDVGASTGGFSQALLERGAAKVYAVDVGSGQLHARLRADPRVVNLEQTDARRLNRDLIPDPVTAIAADVSFISLQKVMPVPMGLAAPGAWLVALVKPQFEAGRQAVSKRGIVRDPAARRGTVDEAASWLARQRGWTVLGNRPSPITGGSGNEEFLIAARLDG